MKKRASSVVKWVRVDGLRTRLLVAPPDGRTDGESPLQLPVLMIHGLGCSAEAWEPTLDEMANRGLCCTTIAPDLPGCGHSAPPPQTTAYDMDELADWCVRLLDVQGVARVHIAGNSMGCQVAFAIARRHADRVGALVLQGPTTGNELVPKWRYVVGLITDIWGETWAYNWRLLIMYSQMGASRYLATAFHMMKDNPLPQLDKVSMPTLVIRGGRDMIVSDKIARRLAAVLPDGAYTPLDTAAHAIEFNNPDEFTSAMVAFLHRAEGTLGLLPVQNRVS